MTGRLFYLMGPSGSGKDSLLKLCQEHARIAQLRVARRYITRPTIEGDERHVSLSREAFRRRQEQGRFALSWEANGYRYGISTEINEWLSQGADVLVNGSRGYLDTAKERYPEDLIPVLINVDSHLVKRRLLERGRESLADIEKRIDRSRLLQSSLPADIRVVANNGDLHEAFAELINLIRPGSSENAAWLSAYAY